MDSFDLPPELADLERRLAERGRAKPDGALRPRVLLAMRDARTANGVGLCQRGVWRFAAMAMAAVLLTLNLAMSLANHRAWTSAGRIERGNIQTAAREMRQRHPEFSEQEAYLFAVLVQSAPTPTAAPALGGSPPDRIIPFQGDGSWDMR